MWVAMMMLDFEGLAARPPMKTTSVTLPDGQQVQMFELPLSVIEDVQEIGQQGDGNVRQLMDNIVRVVAHSLLGRSPTVDELQQIRETFGSSAVMFLYYEALNFSRLGPNSLDEAKKH